MSPNPALLTWPRAAAGGGGPLTATWRTAADNSANASSYTFSGLSIGTASSDRIVVAAVTARKAPPSPTLSSFTIGGVAATVVASAGTASGNLTVIGYAAIPSGTSVAVAVTYSATVLRGGVGVWTITGGSVSATGYTGTGSGTATVDVVGVSDGCVLAAATGTSAGAMTWTNATERYDSFIAGEAAIHSYADTTSTGAFTITGTASGGTSDLTMAAAAFAPA